MYLASRLSNKTTTAFRVKSGIWENEFQLPAYRPAPLDVTGNADPENIANAIESIGSKGQHIEGNAETKFYVVADRDRGTINAKINISFRIQDVYKDTSSNESMSVFLRRYTDERETGGNEFTFKKDYIVVPSFSPVTGQTFSERLELEFSGTEAVKKGESFALYFFTAGDYGNGLGNSGQMQVYIDQFKGSITWNEDSFFRSTTAKCLTAFNTGSRLSEIYTGKPCFESHLLSGRNDKFLKPGQQLLFSPGGWIRNLEKTEEENGVETTKEWPFEMSFDDFYKSIHAVLPVGYGIAIQGNDQKIIFEDLEYFFQRQVLVNLGKIEIKERSTAVEYCYQALKFGYLKGGNYEKPLGLDEYNTQTDTRSPLTVTDNEYSVLGPSRTDSYGVEDARRKQAQEYPDEDTPYDKDNFMIDAKRVQTSIYEVRTWQDDFEQAPTGVYSPDTAFNLNLTPGRNRQRHSFWFNSALVKLKDEAIQFLNSQGNSSLKTKKAGEAALKENQPSIPISELGNPLFEPEWINAEASFSQNILDQLTGITVINGREVNNYYGLAEFTNEKNRIERAFIFSVKVKDKFTFKLLKAYGI